jgi:hypothetical protein
MYKLLTIPNAVDRPSPVPFPGSFVVKKGSNILSIILGAIPVPVSDTVIATYGPTLASIFINHFPS